MLMPSIALTHRARARKVRHKGHIAGRILIRDKFSFGLTVHRDT